nr:Ribosomal protein S8 [Pedinophyceae sp. YPF-701]
MVNDTISDFLTQIRNANLVKSKTVTIPLTKVSFAMSEILAREGYLDAVQKDENELFLQLRYRTNDGKPCITNLRRLSKPGRKVYSKAKDMPRVLGGLGIIIVSTSKGLMTDREARAANLGGELLCSVW